MAVAGPGRIDEGDTQDDRPPELSDVPRFGRMLVRRFVAQARASELPSFRSLVGDHLDRPVDELAVVEEYWPAYEHVNVQAALDAWLAEPGRSHRLVGLADYRHRGSFGLADLLGQTGEHRFHGPRPGTSPGSASPAARAARPASACAPLWCSWRTAPDRLAMLVRGADPENELSSVAVEARRQPRRRRDRDDRPAAGARARAQRPPRPGGLVRAQHVRGALRRAALPRTPERARRGPDPAGRGTSRTYAVRSSAWPATASGCSRSGQHLKRGLLLYGPPGVGKTHTVRYLMSELVGTTIVELTGETLRAIREACSIARSLQPSMIVVEDVDLIAQERDHYEGETPLLFMLLNEMDGLAEDADVVFLLTTNRADLLEPALASRPGRVDQAVHIDLPDREARRRLVELYRGALDVDLARLDDVLDRTDGVTASFLKELLRRAAVVAADRDGDAGADGALSVSADDLDTALDELLDTRNQMTRAVLGYREE